jgi:hypothetical protein
LAALMHRLRVCIGGRGMRRISALGRTFAGLGMRSMMIEGGGGLSGGDVI